MSGSRGSSVSGVLVSATDLLSQPGMLALLRSLDRHQIATGILSPDTADPTVLAEQAQQAGFRVDSSALITAVPRTANAASAAGFETIILIRNDTPASGDRPDAQCASGTIQTAHDPAELAWTPARGLHIKTLDSLPDMTGAPHGWPEPLSASRPLLFLDYDGTLTPIIDDPAQAFLPEAVRHTLAELGRLTTVTIVSGRDLTLLRDMVDIDHLWYAGSHGFEIIGPEGSGISHTSGAEYSPDLDAAEHQLKRLLAAFPGHLIERKRMTIAVHYRGISQSQARQLRHRVEELIAGFPNLHIGHGKMVMEVRPAIHWNKGEAVAWILSRLPEDDRNLLPVYIGDDLTDEDAFRKLAGTGLGIAVRHDESRATAADYAVEDTDAVHTLLMQLLEAVRACER